jgi:hypothetical protein
MRIIVIVFYLHCVSFKLHRGWNVDVGGSLGCMLRRPTARVAVDLLDQHALS